MRRLQNFARAKEGMAAVEFALLAPMLLFLLFGSIDLMDAAQTVRRVENTAVSVADVVARDTEVSNTDINSMWSALNVLMFPDPVTTMDVRITSVSITSATDARVVWSEGRNGFAPLVTGASVPLPADMMVAGTSIIMTDVGYNYQPPLNILFNGGRTLSHTAYRRSRLIDPIPRV